MGLEHDRSMRMGGARPLLWVAVSYCLEPRVVVGAPQVISMELPPTEGEEGWREWQTVGVFGLHVGCGLGLPAGCLNTDVNGIAAGGASTSEDDPFVAVHVDDAAAPQRFFLQHDATKPFPLATGSFEWIFAEHFVEHVPRDGAIASRSASVRTRLDRRASPASRGGRARPPLGSCGRRGGCCGDEAASSGCRRPISASTSGPTATRRASSSTRTTRR